MGWGDEGGYWAVSRAVSHHLGRREVHYSGSKRSPEGSNRRPESGISLGRSWVVHQTEQIIHACEMG